MAEARGGGIEVGVRLPRVVKLGRRTNCAYSRVDEQAVPDLGALLVLLQSAVRVEELASLLLRRPRCANGEAGVGDFHTEIAATATI